MLTICAIIAVRNGGQTLPAVLQHFEDNQIDVIIINNGSTDKTHEIVNRFLGKTVKCIKHVPFNGFFELARLLEIKQQIVDSINTDWVIHADADEIFESPKEGETLRSFIERCSESGLDVINCDEFVFVPQDENEDFHEKDFVKDMAYYYHFSPTNRTLHRIVRITSESLNWSKTGGHRLNLENRRVGPEHARLRHYIGLSFDHLRSQYLGRVFSGNALLRKWHINRVPLNTHFIKAPQKSRLFCLNHDGWRKDKPENKHLFFDQCQPYIPPNQIEDKSERQPLPFIVGIDHSGTIQLRLLLEKKSEMAMIPETLWLIGGLQCLFQKPNFPNQFKNNIMSHSTWQDMNIDEFELKQLLKDFDHNNPFNTIRRIYKFYAERLGKKRYGDITPGHNLSMHYIASALPEAHFIHIIRDGREVVTSQLEESLRNRKSLRDAAMFWLWQIREIRQQAQFIPHYLEVRYEDLIGDTDTELRRIEKFIDLPIDCVQIENKPDSKNRSEVIDENKSVIPALHSIDHWKNELNHLQLATFERIAGDMLADLGYERYTG